MTCRLLSLSSVTLALLLQGCGIGGTSRPAQFYLLTPLPSTTPSLVTGRDGPTVALGPIEIPEFLDRPQMVTKISPKQVELAEFHRWAESLSTGIGRVLREDLAILLGRGNVSAFPWADSPPRDYRVQVIFLDFEPALYREEVLLRALYTITNRRQPDQVVAREETFTVPIDKQSSDGAYPATVEAMSSALSSLAQSIAREVLAAHASHQSGKKSPN